MKKKIWSVLLALCIIPFGVNAESKTVTTEEELRSALEDTTVTEIVLGSNIETNGKINITRDVTIKGSGNAIIYVGDFFATIDGEGIGDNTIWSKKSSDGTTGAVYVLQAYQCKVTLSNILLMGGNRGLGINGAEVTLAGEVYFSSNGFQDIELGRGTGVDTTSVLKLEEGVSIITDEENQEDVTSLLVYIDDAEGQIVQADGTVKTYEAGTSLMASDLATDLVYLIENDSDNKEIAKEVFENLQTNGNNLGIGSYIYNADGTIADIVYVWQFFAGSITDPMVVDTNITFTTEAPSEIKADLEKLVTNYKELSYLNFAHDGKLPGTAIIGYNVSSKYADGTKLYVAHYNETTKELEEAKEVTVEAGIIEFEITECSSYVLYTSTGEATNTTTNTNNTTTNTVENVKTGDINLLLIGSLVGIAVIGLVITTKKIAVNVK